MYENVVYLQLSDTKEFLNTIFSPKKEYLITKVEELEDIPVTRNTLFVFTGGEDISSKLYMESGPPISARDYLEVKAYSFAQKKNAACLGICRGAQFLFVMNKGSLIQDDPVHLKDHVVNTASESFVVTSTHHQLMDINSKHVNKFDTYAWFKQKIKDENGIPQIRTDLEIVKFPKTRSLCIQGHPEYSSASGKFKTYTAHHIALLNHD